MQDFKEASAEIKVKTKRFSLKKGTIKICFELPEEKGQIRSLKLKLRNEIMDVSYPFILHTRSRGNRTVYRAEINVNAYPMERAFWDVVAVVDSGSGETYETETDLFSKMDKNKWRKYDLSLCQREAAV